MKKKVIIIKGKNELSSKIVQSKSERINVDHIIAICALKHPQLLPESLILELNKLSRDIYTIAKHWKKHGYEHMVASEYASMAIELGKSKIKVVEGECLYVPYVYETVKMMHKQFNQTIIEVEFQNKMVCFNGVLMSFSEAAEKFKILTVSD